MDDYYDRIAPGYDELHGEEQERKLTAFLDRVTLKPNSTILDVGCGTGRSILFFEGMQWHGIEPSAGLIAHANPEAKNRILQGRGEDLPYPEGSFDVILSLTALQNYTDPAKGVEEMHRVCKPKGLILLSFIKKTTKRSAFDEIVRKKLYVIESWEEAQDILYVCQREE